MASNMAQIEDEIKQMLLKACKEMAVKAKREMQEETWDFYFGGMPAVYQRTGSLGNTPEVTPVSVSGNSITFDAYLNQDYTYTTGKRPSMNEVLQLANEGELAGFRPVVGKTGFWDRAKERMKGEWQDILQKYCK